MFINYIPATAAVAISSLLLHLDGDFIDSSPAAHVFTAHGGAATSAARSKWGTESFIGTGSAYITCPDSPLFDFSGGRVWSVDCWVYVPTATTLATDNALITSWNSTGNNIAWYIGLDSFNQVRFFHDSDGTPAGADFRTLSNPIGRDAWVHIALWVSATTGSIYCAVNGVIDGTYVTPSPIFDGSASLAVGATADPGAIFPTGLSMSELRICVDTQVEYDAANFTPPPGPY